MYNILISNSFIRAFITFAALQVTTESETTKFFFTDDKKIILEDGKSIDLVHDNEESTLLTLHNIEDKSEGAMLDNITSEQLNDQQVCGLRLVPVSLPDGTSGWVAINH